MLPHYLGITFFLINLNFLLLLRSNFLLFKKKTYEYIII